MKQPSVSVIIVNWNSSDFLRACLTSIVTHTRDTSYEVIVIDAGSFDGAAEMMRRLFPQFRFIQSQTNDGFAKSNNTACKDATGEWLLFLNPDTELAFPAIETLLSEARQAPNAGVLGAKLLNSDGTIDPASVQSLPTIANQLLALDALRRFCPRLTLPARGTVLRDGSEPVRVEALPGACVLIRRDVFYRVGCFSEDYFMYGEDMDLSYRTQRAGLTNYYVPRAYVTHHGGTSSSKTISLFSAVMPKEAMWRYFLRTRGTFYAVAYRGAIGASALLRVMILAAAAPILGAHKRAASKKWRAVLLWALGLDAVVRRYYPRGALVAARKEPAAASDQG